MNLGYEAVPQFQPMWVIFTGWGISPLLWSSIVTNSRSFDMEMRITRG